MKIDSLFIGFDGKKVVDSQKTQKQIDRVKMLECILQSDSEKLTWDAFDNPEEPRTLFQAILNDRKRRVDNKTLMADRPNFCVVTAVAGRAVRLEYYEGHDALSKVYDVRSEELEDKSLPDYLTSDPNAYDPAAFLEKLLGIPKEISKPILDAIHK